MAASGKDECLAARATLMQIRSAARVARASAPGIWEGYNRQRRRVVQDAPFKPRPKLWPNAGLHAAWLGHSTVLLQLDGFTILTDPVLGEKCGVDMGPVTVGLKRLVRPAMAIEDLPPIDLILLSHAHFDHFDRRTLRLLQNRGTAVVTASLTSDLLRVRKFKSVHELGWGEKVRVGPVTVRGIEVRHWGARVRTDAYRGYNGYLIEAAERRIVFGGDTAFTDSFRTIRSAKPVDLAILPVGAYNPWIHVHCNPEQAWKMAQDCRAEFVLPVHHQTFQLSREPYFEPIERCLAGAASHPERVVVQRIGQEWSLA
jgi:L-ascorbate metabolism protein UlaG (beta-lactamase superfamily)